MQPMPAPAAPRERPRSSAPGRCAPSTQRGGATSWPAAGPGAPVVPAGRPNCGEGRRAPSAVWPEPRLRSPPSAARCRASRRRRRLREPSAHQRGRRGPPAPGQAVEGLRGGAPRGGAGQAAANPRRRPLPADGGGPAGVGSGVRGRGGGEGGRAFLAQEARARRPVGRPGRAGGLEPRADQGARRTWRLKGPRSSEATTSEAAVGAGSASPALGGGRPRTADRTAPLRAPRRRRRRAARRPDHALGEDDERPARPRDGRRRGRDDLRPAAARQRRDGRG